MLSSSAYHDEELKTQHLLSYTQTLYLGENLNPPLPLGEEGTVYGVFWI